MILRINRIETKKPIPFIKNDKISLIRQRDNYVAVYKGIKVGYIKLLPPDVIISRVYDVKQDFILIKLEI